MKKYVIYLFSSIMFVGCIGQNNNSATQTTERAETPKIEQVAQPIVDVKTKSDIYKNPEATEKVINEKATKLLGELDYCSIDKSCKVKVLETNGKWAKVQVVDPEWLSGSHIGWVEIATLYYDSPKVIPALVDGSYEIVKEDNQGNIINYYVFYKQSDTDEETINNFALALKKEISPDRQCNINIYDNKAIIVVAQKYPLPDNEYLNVADHYIGMLDFSSNSVWYYPFQDIKYKELGGKNWKKEPIQ